LALLLPTAVGPAASADPTSDKRAEAAKLETQLEADGNQVSVAAEKFNQAQLKLEQVRSSLDKAKAEMARADERMRFARSLLAHAAVQSYVTGGMSTLFSHLAHSDNGDLVLRQQYLRFTAADQRDVLGQLKSARQDFTAVQAHLSDEEKDAAAAAARAEAARRAAMGAEAAERDHLGRVKGELADLVAAEAAKRQAAQLAAHPPPSTALKATAKPANGSGAPAHAPAKASGPPPPVSGGAAAAVAEAERQVGKPYVYGGSGPDSFDCSGLMMWAWRAGGVSLSHSAYTQWFETTRVPISAIQPGDILFFGSSVEGIHHNAMYVGNGQMVEAPHTGLNVRYAGAFRSDLIGAGRPG
jgi:cell wall-associated NlpC family hydrolase